VQWVDEELARQGPVRWEKCFSAVALRAEQRDVVDTDLDGVVELAPQFKVVRDRLPPAAQCRWLLYDFRRKMAATPRDATKQALLKEVDAFEQRARALPGDIAKRPSAVALIGKMREALQRAEDKGGGAGLEKAGPASSPVGGGWAAAIAPDGESVEYAWRAKPHKLRFVRVEPRGGGAKAVYLCTTEASVGVFVDVIQAAGAWREVMSLLRADAITWKGPRVWEPAGGALRVGRRWVVRSPGVRPYPQGGEPPAPSPTHPMQHVSPEAALYLAGLLGCRLPSSQEWQGAYDAHEKGQPGARRNLRDIAWVKQREHVRTVPAYRRSAIWPDAGIFLPSDAAARQGADAARVTDADDGVLWFSPMGSESGLTDLVGSVAEFVHEAPDAFEEAFKEPSKPSATRLREFLDGTARALKVVGGSALSPPELWDGSADRPFTRAYPAGLVKARQGYSDVGFRLAFTAPRVAPVSLVRRVLSDQGYLPELGR
jgi:hypothetical protein